ncbi:MAG: hypothetical protein INR73_01410 [Williamsia sp.]|nr:hypothetical protein [Williamsia sp.]
MIYLQTANLLHGKETVCLFPDAVAACVAHTAGRLAWNKIPLATRYKVLLNFKKGPHMLTIGFEPYNENMHGEINQAMIDYLRVIKKAGR